MLRITSYPPPGQWPALVLARRWECCAWLCLLFLGWQVLEAMWYTRSWRLIHDAPLMHYIAWRMLEGDVPYRDIVDMNFPMSYLLVALALVTFGYDDMAWWQFDLFWMGLTAAGLAALVRPKGWLTACAAALFYMAYHLSDGNMTQGQRDGLMGGFAVWALVFVAWGMERGRLRHGFAAGVLMALACWMKPMAGMLVLGLMGWLALCQRQWRMAFVLGMGVAAVSAVMLAWLAATGALLPWIALLRDFVMPAYPSLGGGADPVDIYFCTLRNCLVYGAFLLLPARADARFQLLAIAIIYGMLHAAAQVKNWHYHMIPAITFFAAFAAYRLRDGLDAPERAMRLTTLAALGWTCWVMGPGYCLTPYYLAPMDGSFVDELTEDLRALALPEGGPVQAMDTTAGAINALYRLRLRLPTRFMYDFMLYNNPDAEYTQAFQREFMDGLAQQMPPAIVITSHSWPDVRPRQERVALIPGLREFLDAHYERRVDKDKYHIYLLRHDE